MPVNVTGWGVEVRDWLGRGRHLREPARPTRLVVLLVMEQPAYDGGDTIDVGRRQGAETSVEATG